MRPFADGLDLKKLIDATQSFFAQHGRNLQVAVPQTFSITDATLADAGFPAIDPSLYMFRQSAVNQLAPNTPDVAIEVSATAAPSWYEAWVECADLGTESDANIEIVQRLIDRACFVALRDADGRPLAVGSFVCHGPWRCFGNLVTRQDARRRGLGSLVLATLLSQRTPAVTNDVLQVDRDNPAVSMYRRYGFNVSHSYHYRVDPESRA